MNRIIRHCLPAALLLVVASFALAQQQTMPTTNPTETGFEPIFNGTSLDGWEGDTKFWRVENGALVGEITPGNTIQQNSFIIWRGGKPKDFELKLDYRISAQGNSGVNYRSSEVDGTKLALKGYQFDIDGERRNNGTTRHTGNNYEERGRTFMALRGQLTRALPEGKREVVSTIGDYTEMTKVIKAGDWNTLHIIARGNTLVHILNGQVMSILLDDDEKNRTAEGLIGVQVHQGPPMKVEYRNIRLKKFD
jgi:hypothetical protein